MSKQGGTRSKGPGRGPGRLKGTRIGSRAGNLGGHWGAFAPNNKKTVAFRRRCGLEPIGGKYAGKTLCLRCDQEFRSEDRRKFRICDRCKDTREWRQGGSLQGPELHTGRDNVPQDVRAPSSSRGTAHRTRMSRTFLKNRRISREKTARELRALTGEESE